MYFAGCSGKMLDHAPKPIPIRVTTRARCVGLTKGLLEHSRCRRFHPLKRTDGVSAPPKPLLLLLFEASVQCVPAARGNWKSKTCYAIYFALVLRTVCRRTPVQCSAVQYSMPDGRPQDSSFLWVREASLV